MSRGGGGGGGILMHGWGGSGDLTLIMSTGSILLKCVTTGMLHLEAHVTFSENYRKHLKFLCALSCVW